MTSAKDKIKTTWNIIDIEAGWKSNNNKDCLPKTFQNKVKKINIDEAVHSFNKYFTSITENVNIKNTNVYTAMSYLHTHFPNGFPEMDLNLASEEETISIINKLKSKNSSGYDGITNKLLKLSKQQISKPLTYAINKSLIMGVYPERLKFAIINPVYNKGE